MVVVLVWIYPKIYNDRKLYHKNISKRSHKPRKSIFVISSKNSLFTTVDLGIRKILNTLIASYVADNASKRSKKPGKSIVNQSSKNHSKNNLFTTVVVYRWLQTKIKSWTMDALNKTLKHLMHTYDTNALLCVCLNPQINQMTQCN